MPAVSPSSRNGTLFWPGARACPGPPEPGPRPGRPGGGRTPGASCGCGAPGRPSGAGRGSRAAPARDADAERRAQRRQLVDELRRRDQPTRAEGGGEDLRRRAEVDDDVGVHAVQGRQRADVVAELAVVVVLDDDRSGGPGPRDQCLPAADRKPPAERVLMGGRGVEQLEIAGEFLGDDAVRVDPARHDPRPGPAQHLPARGIARFLDAGLLARRQEASANSASPLDTPWVIRTCSGPTASPRDRRR